MTWDVEFYSSLMGNSDFANGISTLSKEYFANAVAPYGTFQLIAGSGTPTLNGVGHDGLHLIQLNIWASKASTCEELARYAANAANNSLNVSRINRRSLGRDDGDELHGIAVDFEIWFENP